MTHAARERGRESEAGRHMCVCLCVLVWARLICQLVHLDNCPAINKISSNLRAERRKRTNEQGKARQGGARRGRGDTQAGRQYEDSASTGSRDSLSASVTHACLAIPLALTHTLLIYSVTIFIWPPHPLLHLLLLPLLLSTPGISYSFDEWH